MKKDLSLILDECIDLMNRGESLDSCLERFGERAEELAPLLRGMARARDAYSFDVSDGAKRAARRRFDETLERNRQTKRERRSFFEVLTRPWVLAAVSAAIVFALVVYFALIPAGSPGGGPVLVADPNGNFAFTISDAPNAIGDFESLTVSISRVGVLSDNDGWIEFTPEVHNVDLTQVVGDAAVEIWRGDIPPGSYRQVFVYVSDVTGILKESGERVDVKLPGRKLHLSLSFQVSQSSVTTFTYDLTVTATGSTKSGLKYNLKPQISESGADSRQREDKNNENNENNENKDNKKDKPGLPLIAGAGLSTPDLTLLPASRYY